MDGDYQRTLPLRLTCCDTLVFLDYPTWLFLAGVFVRLIKYFGKNRVDMALGCRERFNWQFIKYVFSFRRKIRPRILEMIDEMRGKLDIIILTDRKQTGAWLDTLSGIKQ